MEQGDVETTGLGQGFEPTRQRVELEVPLRLIPLRMQDAMSVPMVVLARGKVAFVQIATVASIDQVLVRFVTACRYRDEVVDRQLATHIDFRDAAVAASAAIARPDLFVLGVGHLV